MYEHVKIDQTFENGSCSVAHTKAIVKHVVFFMYKNYDMLCELDLKM